MDRLTNSGLLGMPRSVMIALAIPGLVMFVAIFGYATYSALTQLIPWSPTWLSISLSIIGPIVALLVIGVVGALHHNKATQPTAKKLTHAAEFVVAVGLIAGLVVQLLGLL